MLMSGCWLLAGLIPPRYRHPASQGRLRATEAIYKRAPPRVTHLFTSAHDDLLARECGMRYAYGSEYIIRTFTPSLQTKLY